MKKVISKILATVAITTFCSLSQAEIIKCIDHQGNTTYSNVKAGCPAGGKRLDIPENYPKAVPYVPKYEASPPATGFPGFFPQQGPQTGMPLPKMNGAPSSLPPLPGSFAPIQVPPASAAPAPSQIPMQTQTQSGAPIPEGQGGVFLKPPTESK